MGRRPASPPEHEIDTVLSSFVAASNIGLGRRLAARVQRDAEGSDLLLIEDQALGLVDLGPQLSAVMTTSSTVGLVSPSPASLAEILSTTFSCSALLSLSISALALASLARRSAFSARRPAISALEIGGAVVRLCRYQPRSNQQLVAVALDQMLDVLVAWTRLHRAAQALKRLFDRGLRQLGGRRHLFQGAPFPLWPGAPRNQLARHFVDRVTGVDERLLAGQRGRPRAGPVGLCGGSSAGANPVGGLPEPASCRTRPPPSPQTRRARARLSPK